MTRYIFSAFFFLLISTLSQAQLLDASKKIFADEPFFNIQFAAENKIKALTAELSYKRDKEKIISKNSTQRYEFDTLGRMTRMYTTFRKSGGDFDTTFTFFEYDSLNRISVKRLSDNFGFYSYSYDYDEKGNIIKETYCREISSGGCAGNFVPEKRYPLGTEIFEYQYLGPNHYKKKMLNNLGMPFKEILYMTDNAGRVIEETGTFIATRHMERKSFEYDNQGRIARKTEYSDIAGGVNISWEYTYDEKNNLLDIRKKKGEDTVEITEFLLDSKGTVTAKLTRIETEKIIDIQKFTAEFWPEKTEDE
jgi:hypothetical protein